MKEIIDVGMVISIYKLACIIKPHNFFDFFYIPSQKQAVSQSCLATGFRSLTLALRDKLYTSRLGKVDWEQIIIKKVWEDVLDHLCHCKCKIL